MQIGPYLITGELGRGGAGVVLRGRGPDGRDVAIKLLQRVDGERGERFARERELQAELAEHGFVRLLDSGESPQGPYLVMAFLSGGTLRARLAKGPLPIDEAVEVVTRLAEAMGEAHARGIVHRDLKPENVLFDELGAPVIADLGLAKRSGSQAGLSLSHTGEFRGTAGYMAPEQMKDAKAAGPTADVFALGAILYECLAGEPAFVAENVVEVIDRVDSGKFAPVTRLRADVPRWLTRVLHRCLARRPEDRFPDGRALAEALEAGPGAPSRAVPAALFAAFLLCVAAGAGWAGRETAPPPATERPATEAATGTPATESSATEAPATEAPATEAPATEPLATEAPDAEVEPAAARPEAWRGVSRGSPQLGQAAIDHDLKVSTRLELVSRLGSTRLKHTAGIDALAIAAVGTALLAGDEHGQLRAWLFPEGAQTRRPIAVEGGRVVALSPSADGLRAAALMGDGRAWVVDLPTARSTRIDGGEAGKVTAVALSPDGARVATGCAEDKGLRVFDLVERRQVFRAALETGGPTALAFTPDGRRLVCGASDGACVVWNIDERTQGRTLKGAGFEARRIATDGRRMAVTLAGKATALIDLDGQGGVEAQPFGGAALALAFDPAGQLVIVEPRDVLIVDPATLKVTRRVAGLEPMRAAAITPDGARVVFAGVKAAHALVTLDLRTAVVTSSSPGHGGWITAVVERDAGLFTASADGKVRRWESLDRSTVLADADQQPFSLDVSADGQALVAGWGGGALRFLALRAGKVALSIDGNVAIGRVALLPDGRRALVANGAGLVDLVDPRAPEPVSWRAHDAGVLSALPLPDGRVITWGFEGEGASLALWPAPAAPRPLRRLQVPRGRMNGLALDPGAEATVLLGCADGRVRIYDLATDEAGQRIYSLHQGAITCLAVSPDGALAATGAVDRTLRLWDPKTGEELERLALLGSADLVTSLGFSRDGRDLLIGTGTGCVIRMRREER